MSRSPLQRRRPHRHGRWALLAALLGIAVPAGALPRDVLTETEARARGARVSSPSYDVELGFEQGSPTYRGRTRIRFRLEPTGEDLRVDFRSTGLGIVEVNGRCLENPPFDGTHIDLPADRLAGGENVIEVSYVNEFDRTGSGVHRFVDPADRAEYIYTDFEPFLAHRLFPCFDQPDLKGTYRLEVVAPRTWQVIANSRTRSVETTAAISRHLFEETPPLSTYLVFVGAGDYVEFVDREAPFPSRMFARRSLAGLVDASVLFAVTRRGMAHLESWFGIPFPFTKYDQIFVPEYPGGAMENPGAVTLSEEFLFRQEPTAGEVNDRVEAILHELAHMWFGNLVTMSWWDGLWLNESFAMWLGMKAVSEITPSVGIAGHFLSGAKAWAYWQDQLPSTHPVAGAVADTDAASASFDGITYGKGAALLGQLESSIGADTFREGIRAYMGRHAWNHAGIDDFFAALSAASGRDLGGWRRAHLETAGVNTIEVRWSAHRSRITSFEILQGEGNGDRILRPQTLEVALYDVGPEFDPAAAGPGVSEQRTATAASAGTSAADDGGPLGLTRTITVTVVAARTPVPELVDQDEPEFVWPNNRDLAYARVFLDPVSLAFARRGLHRLADDLTRRGVWLTLKEMVRDERLPATDYLDIVLDQAPREPGGRILETLVPFLRQVLDHHAARDPARTRARAHRRAREQLARAPPGSDAQKVWFELAVATATGPDGLTWLHRLLEGPAVPAGLVLGPERRWTVLARLSALDDPDLAGLHEQESGRDTSDRGVRRGLHVQACRPDPAVKEALWKRFLEDRETSQKVLDAAMEGFHRPERPELSRVFVARYFGAIPSLIESHDPLYVESFSKRLYPDTVHDPAVIEATDAFLAARPHLPGDLRRLLVDARDELARCLRIRARDRGADGEREQEQEQEQEQEREQLRERRR